MSYRTHDNNERHETTDHSPRESGATPLGITQIWIVLFHAQRHIVVHLLMVRNMEFSHPCSGIVHQLGM